MVLHFKNGRARFLDQRVPRTAILTLPLPTGRDAPALLTNIAFFGLGHNLRSNQNIARTQVAIWHDGTTAIPARFSCSQGEEPWGVQLASA